MDSSLFLVLGGLVCLSLAASPPARADDHGPDEPPLHGATDQIEAFKRAAGADWQTAFEDPGTGNWRAHWFLDGQTATVETGQQGMTFTAGPTFGDHADHAVLWTRESFAGDLRVDFDFTRVDHATRAVNILYILATGSGQGPYARDIARWSDQRQVPYMRTYFQNMNLLHISYAAFGNEDTGPKPDYIRARRYLATEKLAGTELEPDVYTDTGLFDPGVPHHITVIKRGDDLWMMIRNPDQRYLAHWPTDAFPPVTEGRVGLRQMFTRAARYANFTIATLESDGVPARP